MLNFLQKHLVVCNSRLILGTIDIAVSESVRLKIDIWGTQREILRKRPKNNNKVGIKLSEAILSILRDCWEKTYLFLMSPSKTDGRVPSQQGAPTTPV